MNRLPVPRGAQPVIASLLAGLLAGSAHAGTMALDPQTRVHAGVVHTLGGGNALTGGFDARLTRMVAIDVGAFASPTDIDPAVVAGGYALPTSAVLRHGVYLAPGVRLPHAQPRAWAWEAFLRAGGGVAWATDVNPEAVAAAGSLDPRAAMAGCVGADVLARVGAFGARVSGKAWMFDITQAFPARDFLVTRTQVGVEALVQW